MQQSFKVLKFGLCWHPCSGSSTDPVLEPFTKSPGMCLKYKSRTGLESSRLDVFLRHSVKLSVRES